VIGLIYGIYLSGYDGYSYYLAIDPLYRRRGIVTQLLRMLMESLRQDAASEGAGLPFVV
jgi:ribosomal protein S18 acetylase RimI-like enzyme